MTQTTRSPNPAVPALQLAPALRMSMNTTGTVNDLAIDGAGELVLVALGAGHGVVSLGSIRGLEFVDGDGTLDRSMFFYASVAAANTALAGLVYRSDTGYQGEDRIRVGLYLPGEAGEPWVKAGGGDVPVHIGRGADPQPEGSPFADLDELAELLNAGIDSFDGRLDGAR